MIMQTFTDCAAMVAQAQASYAVLRANPGASAAQLNSALAWVIQTERSLQRVQQLTYGTPKV